jgi:predicted lipid-binding transport protein (Tim44 family)
MPTERTVEHPDGRVERITENDPAPAPAAAPVVVESRRGGGLGGGLGGVIALILGLALVLIIGWFLMNMNRNDAIESNAIAGAAESVGGAADNIGDAARDAVPDRPAPAN